MLRGRLRVNETGSLKCLTAGGEKLIKMDPPKNYAFYIGSFAGQTAVFTMRDLSWADVAAAVRRQ